MEERLTLPLAERAGCFPLAERADYTGDLTVVQVAEERAPSREKPRPLSQGPLTAMARPRILVIEDERALTDVLAYNLQREGYEVLVAHDGQEGLRKAQMQSPDLILLDLMLPKLDGLEVCRELRSAERTRHVP